MKHWPVHILASASLLVCLAILLVWARSYTRAEEVILLTRRPSGVRLDVVAWDGGVSRGQVGLVRDSTVSTYETAREAERVADTDRRRRFVHTSGPAVRPMTSNASVWSRLGFAYQRYVQVLPVQPPGSPFVPHEIRPISATNEQRVYVAPLWPIALATGGLPAAWLLSRRRRRVRERRARLGAVRAVRLRPAGEPQSLP